jgi:hypothetical protein
VYVNRYFLFEIVAQLESGETLTLGANALLEATEQSV